MLTGVINQNNLEEVFRKISQKRKQGILDIDFGDVKISIFLINGKIVEVIKFS